MSYRSRCGSTYIPVTLTAPYRCQDRQFTMAVSRRLIGFCWSPYPHRQGLCAETTMRYTVQSSPSVPMSHSVEQEVFVLGRYSIDGVPQTPLSAVGRRPAI